MISRFGHSGYSNNCANYGAKIINSCRNHSIHFIKFPLFRQSANPIWPTGSKSLGRSDNGSDGGAIEPLLPKITEVVIFAVNRQTLSILKIKIRSFTGPIIAVLTDSKERRSLNLTCRREEYGISVRSGDFIASASVHLSPFPFTLFQQFFHLNFCRELPRSAPDRTGRIIFLRARDGEYIIIYFDGILFRVLILRGDLAPRKIITVFLRAISPDIAAGWISSLLDFSANLPNKKSPTW